MIPFFTKFPLIAEKDKRALTVRDWKKPDSLPPDTYYFIDYYCNEKDCDCRQVMITVITEKQGDKVLASINMGLDSEEESFGPLLDPLQPQSEHAEELLDCFVDMINQDSSYLEMLRRHYVMLKENIDESPYQGSPFKDSGKPRIAKHSLFEDVSDILTLIEGISTMDGSKAKQDDQKPAGKFFKEMEMVKTLFSGLWKDSGEVNIEDLIKHVSWHLRSQTDDKVMDKFFKNKIVENPELVYPLLEEILDVHSPKGLNPDLTIEYEASIFLLQEFLTEIRYSVERNREWAKEASEKIQLRIAERAFQVNVDTRVQSDLLQCLYRAGLEVHPSIKEKSEELAEYYSRFTARGGSSGLERMFDAMIADGFQDPYELIDFVMAELAIISEEGQLSVIAEMCQSKYQLIRDFAGLMLLHPNAEVRQHVPMIFHQFADETAISPDAFRRMIGLRNWLPEDERPAVDSIIKKVRMARVECAPMPVSKVDSVSVSTFDGSGIQGAWLFSTNRKKYHISGLLVRQQEGVREAWVRKDLNKSEKNSIHRDIAGSIVNCKVNIDYINQLVSHFLWEGVNQRHPPPPELLQVAEVIGHTYWQPTPIQYDKELERLKKEANPKYFKPAYVSRILNESRNWAENKAFAHSWFEDDARIDDMLHDQMLETIMDQRRFNKITNKITNELFEEKRFVWFERLMWMAIWSKAAIGKAPFPWEKFLILAHEIHKGTPLKKIPLINGIVERSIFFSFRRNQRDE